MNVLMISPGFPDDLGYFTRGLAGIGARVLGVGDSPRGALDPDVSRALSGYLQVRDLWDEAGMVAEVRSWLGGREVDRVECLWEPGVVLAARLREAFGVPGMRSDRAVAFRDKETMKAVLDAAGVRTPRHARASTQNECREAAERIGYPLIIKPIAGAGSADTYPLRGPEDMEDALERMGHVPEVSVEEFIEGEEYTYDTISVDGQPLFENVAWYRPKPLVMRLNPWISPQAVCLKDLEREEIAVGRRLGRDVLDALGFESGITHMEWFRTPEGEAVFGEIGARAPGGRLTHGMNFAAEVDLFTGWAEAVCTGRFSQDGTKKYNAALVFKRASGGGDRITRIEGLDGLMAEFSEHMPLVDIVSVGDVRRDWRKIVTGDGWLCARHPDLDATLYMADHIGTDLVIHAD